MQTHATKKECLIDRRQIEHLKPVRGNPDMLEGTIGSIMDIRVLRSGFANLHRVEKVGELEKNCTAEYGHYPHRFFFNGEVKHADANEAPQRTVFRGGVEKVLVHLDNAAIEKREDGIYLPVRWLSDCEILKKVGFKVDTKARFKMDAHGFISLKDADEVLNRIIYGETKVGEGLLSEKQVETFKSICWVFRRDIEYAASLQGDVMNFVETDSRVKQFRFGDDIKGRNLK
jgi:hypothetical protein